MRRITGSFENLYRTLYTDWYGKGISTASRRNRPGRLYCQAVPVDGKAPKNAETKTCVTNDDGFFEIGGLIYQGQGSYDIQVETTGSDFSLDPVRVDFDTDTNLKTNVIFYVDTYYIYSGNVYYEDSSIPVQGVKFKMDGKTITDANGVAITTNTQGEFELSIPKGEHQVQAVKEGHVFENEGFLLVPNA